MLSKKTVHTFLNSASVNMSKQDYSDLAKHLRHIPELHDAVVESQTEIHEKKCRIMQRHFDAARHLAARLEDAQCATRRAIEHHKRAQENLKKKLETSRYVESCKHNRIEHLDSQIYGALNHANELEAQLQAIKSEDIFA